MAEYEIILHGNPLGHSQTDSKLIKSDFFLNFYKNNLSGEKLFVTTHDNNCTMYTLCIYSDRNAGPVFIEAAPSGRPGGYVGISLAVDSDFKFDDPQWVFEKLREIYNQYILNNLIKPRGKAYQWIDSAPSLFRSPTMKNKFIKNIEQWFNSRYIAEVQKATPQHNENTPEQTVDSAKSSQIQSATAQLQAEIAELEAQLNTKRQQLAQLQQQSKKK